MRTLLFIALQFSFLFLSAQSIQDQVSENLNNWISLYESLHTSPEVSSEEKETSERLATILEGLGYEVTRGVGGYGIVGLMENGPGPVILVRTDMDALPVTEQTGLPYSSQTKTMASTGTETGIMHACGHDIHMTNWVGTATLMASRKDQWSGTLLFIGQPAEETGAGAKGMLDAQLFERFPRPEMAFGMHVLPDLAAGRIGYRAKGAMASVDMLRIVVHGRGGHGASPHQAIDPIVLAASMIMDFQTIVSRNVSPFDPAVVTVGAIHGGTKGNIIPEKVEMLLTLRTYDVEVRTLLLKRLKEIGDNKAAGMGLTEEEYPEIHFAETSTPVTYNDPELTAQVNEAIAAELGAEVLAEVGPFTFGEDFSRYSQPEDIRGVMFYLGTVSEDRLRGYAADNRMPPGLHSAYYYPDAELSIKTGVTAMTAVLLEVMGE